jgi:hypothetical protein
MVRDVGDALAAACRPLHRPQPVAEPLQRWAAPAREVGAG